MNLAKKRNYDIDNVEEVSKGITAVGIFQCRKGKRCRLRMPLWSMSLTEQE